MDRRGKVPAPKMAQRKTNCNRQKTCWEWLHMYQTASY